MLGTCNVQAALGGPFAHLDSKSLRLGSLGDGGGIASRSLAFSDSVGCRGSGRDSAVSPGRNDTRMLPGESPTASGPVSLSISTRTDPGDGSSAVMTSLPLACLEDLLIRSACSARAASSARISSLDSQKRAEMCYSAAR